MTRIYIIPVTLLYQAADLLQPPERLCFVTGVKLFDGRIIVLTQLIEVDSIASRVHVAPYPASVLRAQQRLLAMGLDIEAQFHSHPGRTRKATFPSNIDLTTARCWETAPFLGAVFSEGGRYVRFFNHSQQSEVSIHGYCIQTNDPNCFELPENGCIAMPTGENQPLRCVADRQAGEAPVVESETDSIGLYPYCGMWGPWF
jgi:hypothetical protein